MKTFEAWLKDGPLAGQFFSRDELQVMKIAYLEGQSSVLQVATAKLGALLPADSATRPTA